MLVALGAAGILGTSWVYRASDFFAKYGAGGKIFGFLLTCAVRASTAFGMRFAGAIQLLLLAAMVTIWLALAALGFTNGSIDNFWAAYAQDSDPLASTLRFALPGLTFLTGFSLVSVMAEDADLTPRRVAHAVLHGSSPS